VVEDFYATHHEFYADFARTLREGAPLVISPESVRRNIALIETCKSLTHIPQGQFALQPDH